ncbi:MAG: NADH:flavin oxidoreductase, partial [Bacteroidia bacterium]|nr:NADH:flavin oxidoreductase [Bacteroidia bacterium]
LENRSRLLIEIIDGIRKACGTEFLLGVRLSPERFGMDLGEVKTLCLQLVNDGNIDFLDLSLWDVFKLPEDEKYRDKDLLTHITDLDHGNVRLTVAGKIRSAKDVKHVLDSGIDFVTLGRSAILHHDFPRQVIKNLDFNPVELPVTTNYLRQEGLGDAFIQYMQRWPGFVE